jgi:uncharacterized membrane protein YphA (DoxX/SURF4 family)
VFFVCFVVPLFRQKELGLVRTIVEGLRVFEKYCRDKLAPLALRLALGLACVYHGYLKIMASGGTAWHTSLPVAWQLVIAWGEFGAGLALLVGLRCRLAAAAAVAVIVGLVAWQDGWNVLRLSPHTLEPILLLVLIGLALVFQGGGDLTLAGRSGSRGGAAKFLQKK